MLAGLEVLIDAFFAATGVAGYLAVSLTLTTIVVGAFAAGGHRSIC